MTPKEFYVGQKVDDMVRRGIPAGINSKTGAALPDWKRDLDKGEESARKARHLAGRVALLLSIAGALGHVAESRRPPRPLSDHEKWRRGIALARARDAAARATKIAA